MAEAKEESLQEECKKFGIELEHDKFSISLKLHDGKILKYAIFDSKAATNSKAATKIKFEELLLKLPFSRGRLFGKDGNFLGYVNAGDNLEEILVNIDLMQ